MTGRAGGAGGAGGGACLQSKERGDDEGVDKVEGVAQVADAISVDTQQDVDDEDGEEAELANLEKSRPLHLEIAHGVSLLAELDCSGIAIDVARVISGNHVGEQQAHVDEHEAGDGKFGPAAGSARPRVSATAAGRAGCCRRLPDCLHLARAFSSVWIGVAAHLMLSKSLRSLPRNGK